MIQKKIRQKYFVSKELRISISLIILWTLLVTAFFTYLAKELGGKIGHGLPLFIIIMAGYAIIVTILTMLFSHRLIGPFQRLQTEIRMILAGDFKRRLHVRKNDDLYIKSFVSEVNRLIEEMDRMQGCQSEIINQFDLELLNLLATLEEGVGSKDEIRNALLSLHKRLRMLSGKKHVEELHTTIHA